MSLWTSTRQTIVLMAIRKVLTTMTTTKNTKKKAGRLVTSGAGFLRVLDRMLVVDHLEGLLVDLFGG